MELSNLSKERLYLRFVVSQVLLLIAATLSYRSFPQSFDWRYQVVSDLLSQKKNPLGSWWSSTALLVAFILLLPLCSTFHQELRATSARLARAAHFFLRLGMATSIGVGVERLLIRDLSSWMPNAHEILALVAFTSLALGILGFWWIALAARARSARKGCRPAVWLYFVSTFPFIGIFTSQAYLYFVPNSLGWVSPHWATLGVPLYLSFAFWEWLSVAALFAYLFGILWFLPKR